MSGRAPVVPALAAVFEHTPAESAAARDLAELALAEDIGSEGDLTATALPDPSARASAVIRARQPGVLAGSLAAALVIETVDPSVTLQWEVKEGERFAEGDRLAELSGPLGSVLAAERTALNFLCHLSGVATLTAAYAAAIERAAQRRPAGSGLCVLRDTRKTLPGLRLLEKAAVRAGGGENHRLGLSDGILIKDNHIAACGSLGAALERVRSAAPGMPAEVEADTLAQVAEAVGGGADLILCDNMTVEELAEAVRVAGRVPVEASGGIGLDSCEAVAATGVAYIAVGALTHSAPAVDIGLDIEGPARRLPEGG